MNDNTSIKIARLITLEKKFRTAENLSELGFVCANELRSVVDYNFLFFLTKSATGRQKVQTISDISVVDRTAPTVTFVERLINKKKVETGVFSEVSISDLREDGSNLDLPENFPSELMVVPLISRTKGDLGSLVIVRSAKVSNTEKELLQHIAETFSHALDSFLSRGSILSFFGRIFSGWLKWLILSAIALAMFMPINISAVAPVEVIAKNPSVVTSPVNGVVKKVLVNTNDAVDIGMELVKLDDLNFKSQYEINLQELEVAEAELLRAKQSSFTNDEAKAKLVELSTEVALKKKQVAYAEEQLKYSVIKAEVSGVAVVEDFIDWQGRPVNIGEKILTIANSDDIEFLIYLPTKDSLFIEKSARVKVFLDSSPLSSIEGKILRTSYKPELTAENILAYKIHASLEDNIEPPRIGLRGSAKIYGDRTSLFYYIFRVPINISRQFLGI